uniref:Uncharacterized protein n=1 Tax=Anopheles atroparvus TaxID=41427 RepID=A0AAG5CU72_ANOAO
MLLPFDGSTVERLQRSHFKTDHRNRKDEFALPTPGHSMPAELAARNEDIAPSIVSSVVASTFTVSAGSPRALYVRVADSMAAQANTTPPIAMVPAPTPSLPATIPTPTDPPTRKVDILIYPTVSPETIVVPILSCIIGFPIFALLVICCLRRRAKIARERDRRRNFDLQANTITLVRFNSHHLNSQRSILLQSGDSLSRGYPSLDLDTVYEEKSDTHCSGQLDSPAARMLLTDSPPDTDNEHC